MTDLSTTNLKRLLAETSPGPWEALATYGNGAPRPDTTREMRAAGEYLGIMHAPNAELAALSPDLAQEVIALRSKLAAQEAAVLDLPPTDEAPGDHDD